MSSLVASNENKFRSEIVEFWPLITQRAENQFCVEPTSEYSARTSLWMGLSAWAAYAESNEATAIFNDAGCDRVIPIKNGDTELYLAQHPNDGSPFTVLAFRGTSGFKDLLTDSKFFPKLVPWNTNYSAHEGFLDALNLVWEDVEQHLLDIKPEILYLTGHSLGGALAVLTASRLAEDCDLVTPTAVYTIGCPRVGNRALVKSTEEAVRVYRVVWAGDFVTRLPPWCMGYRHVGVEYWLRPDSLNKKPVTYIGRVIHWLFPADTDITIDRKASLSEKLNWLQVDFGEFKAAYFSISIVAIFALLLTKVTYDLLPVEIGPMLAIVLAFIFFILIRLGINLIPEDLPRWLLRYIRYQRLRDHSAADYARELAGRFRKK